MSIPAVLPISSGFGFAWRSPILLLRLCTISGDTVNVGHNADAGSDSSMLRLRAGVAILKKGIGMGGIDSKPRLGLSKLLAIKMMIIMMMQAARAAR